MEMSNASLPLTLPARYYTDPEIFRRELESFYFGRWICAGRASSIPNSGDYFLFELANESVIVLRDTSGEVRAFYNVCRHRGSRMCTEHQGSFSSRRITCPYHAWSYGLDGALLGAPHAERPGFSASDYPLHSIHTEVWEGNVFLHFGRPEQSVAEMLAPVSKKFANWRMAELRTYRRIVYEVKANWKLVILNYNECLHCPFVHPELNPLTDYLGADNDPPNPAYIGGVMFLRNGVETMSFQGSRNGRACIPGLTEEQHKWAAFYSIYPNLLLAPHPDYLLTHTLRPKAADCTEIVCELHFHPDEMARPGFHAEDAGDFWDLINRQDWRIVELSQAGISSRAYTPGPYTRREDLLRAFDLDVLAVDGK
jgi:glycine betaine catabolism A